VVGVRRRPRSSRRGLDPVCAGDTRAAQVHRALTSWLAEISTVLVWNLLGPKEATDSRSYRQGNQRRDEKFKGD
jgi:hypothetical protein